jgi:hypothetical protein
MVNGTGTRGRPPAACTGSGGRARSLSSHLGTAEVRVVGSSDMSTEWDQWPQRPFQTRSHMYDTHLAPLLELGDVV